MESSYIVGRNVKRCSHVQKHFLNMLKSPHDPASPLLGLYPREMKTCPHKNLYTNVHSSISHDSEKFEATQISMH